MKKIDRRLLVYILRDDSETVFIDVVETTRNGHSYKYDGEVWNRGALFFDREKCTNQKGREWRMAPLRRDYIPSWVEGAEVEVCESAKERYELWKAKKLKPRNET